MNLSMKSVRSDSKLLICSDCFSISFSSLVKLSVFCGVGALFSVCSLWVFELRFLVLPAHRILMVR